MVLSIFTFIYLVLHQAIESCSIAICNVVKYRECLEAPSVKTQRFPNKRVASICK